MNFHSYLLDGMAQNSATVVKDHIEKLIEHLTATNVLKEGR